MRPLHFITEIIPFENRVRAFQVPAVRMIGRAMRHTNETSVAPIPLFWKAYHRQYEARANLLPRLLDTTLSMFGEYDAATRAYTYMICVMCPADTPVPEGFDHRDLPPCLLAHGTLSAFPPNAHDTGRFLPEVRALGLTPGGHAGYGFEFYPDPGKDACCVLFEVTPLQGGNATQKEA